MPETTMFILKLVTEPGFDATCSVRVAGTTAPASKLLPSLFQVKVKTELAVAGVHPEVERLRVSAVFPEFLT